MSSANNPAGRLHAILIRWEDARRTHEGQTLRTIWSQALGVEDPTLSIARVAGLVGEVADAARAYEADTGDESPSKNVARYADQWAIPFFYSPVGATHGLQDGAGEVNEGAMLGLESVASLLRSARPEGTDVGESDRADLRGELDELIQQVRDDDALDPSLKLLVLTRLRDVGSALDHYYITGPGGLAAASELLATAVARGDAEDRDASSHLRAVWAFARKVIRAVAFVGAAGDAANAIETGVRYLGGSGG